MNTFELVIILEGFLHRKLHGHDTNSVRLIFWCLTIILIHVGDRHLHSKYLKILIYSAIVTGPALLIGGFLAYALSKEILVIHDEVLLLLKCRPALTTVPYNRDLCYSGTIGMRRSFSLIEVSL